jgi:hypothetical protein
MAEGLKIAPLEEQNARGSRRAARHGEFDSSTKEVGDVA